MKSITHRRWIFNLIHGHLIGLIVFLFASELCICLTEFPLIFFYFVLVCNIGMGIFLIEKSQGSYDTPRTLILYIIFVVIILCLQLVLFIVYTIQGMKAPVEGIQSYRYEFKLCNYYRLRSSETGT